MTTREKIKPEDNMDTLIEKMAEGNREAEKIISLIFRDGNGIDYLLKLDNQNIRGEQIVCALRKCKSVKDLKKALDKHDHTLIEYINVRCLELGNNNKTRARYI